MVTCKPDEELFDHVSKTLTDLRECLYLVEHHVSNQVPGYVLDNITIEFEYRVLPNTFDVVFN